MEEQFTGWQEQLSRSLNGRQRSISLDGMVREFHHEPVSSQKLGTVDMMCYGSHFKMEHPTSTEKSPAVTSNSQLQSSCVIPVPKHRLDEAIAAAALTSLSSSPLVVRAESCPAECSIEPCRDNTAISSSCSSINSCDLNVEASDPFTSSPPLRSAPPCVLPDAGIEDSDTTHFLFGDPIPRKRKNSGRRMFRCLWKNCGKVLSTSAAIQKHVRVAHLGRHTEQQHNDGEEDFYYTEMDVNVETLTDGLSSLTPTSPTSACPPSFSCVGSLGETNYKELPLLSPLSMSAPSTLCHVQTDHAYQALSPASVSTSKDSFLWSPPPLLIKAPPVLPLLLTTVTNPKPSAGARKPRGEAKKCRKVYGMERRDLWCTACRWKKACQRFLD